MADKAARRLAPVRFVDRREVRVHGQNLRVIENWSDGKTTRRWMGDAEKAAWLRHGGNP